MTSRIQLILGESGWICVDAGEPCTIKDLAGLGWCWVSGQMGGWYVWVLVEVGSWRLGVVGSWWVCVSLGQSHIIYVLLGDFG